MEEICFMLLIPRIFNGLVVLSKVYGILAIVNMLWPQTVQNDPFILQNCKVTFLWLLLLCNLTNLAYKAHVI